jgi:CDP-paratose 2-epimerase
MNRSLLITGGCGFVGSNLAILFKKFSPETRVIVMDNLKRRGSELNIPRLSAAGIKFIHGDIRNIEDLASMPAVDVLIESSAEPSVLAGFAESPDYLINTNLVGAFNCFEFARKHSAMIIFLSSSRVYPHKLLNSLKYTEGIKRFYWDTSQNLLNLTNFQGISEAFPLTGARSLYGATKLCAEYLLEEYADMYGVKYVTNRCGVIAGPWQFGKVDQGVFTLWILNHYFKRPLEYIGYGGNGK